MASSEPSNQLFTSSVYNKLKFIATILLPAVATLYIGLAELWNLSYAFQIAGTITLLDTALGVVLRWSSGQYYRNQANFDGEVSLVQTEEGPKVKFDMQKDPAEVLVDEPGKHSYEFRINRGIS